MHPLADQRGLAKAGWGREEDEATSQPQSEKLYQAWPWNQARAHGRDMEFRRQERDCMVLRPCGPPTLAWGCTSAEIIHRKSSQRPVRSATVHLSGDQVRYAESRRLTKTMTTLSTWSISLFRSWLGQARHLLCQPGEVTGQPLHVGLSDTSMGVAQNVWVREKARPGSNVAQQRGGQ